MIGQSSVCIQSSVSWEIPTVSDSVELKLECKSKRKITVWTQTNQMLHNPAVSEKNVPVKLQTMSHKYKDSHSFV